MTIYIAGDGNWGDAYNIALIDDSKWNDDDYQLMETWNERSLLEYAEAASNHKGITPTEWEKKQ